MLRKFALAFVAAIMISVCGISQAATKKYITDKYNGPLLKSCTIYQIGENEFIMKLSGRKLPRPECEAQNDSLHVTFNDSKIYHPDAIISSLTSTIDGIPMIHDVNAENLSDDAGFWGVVTVSAHSPLSVQSLSRSHNGWQMRIKATAENLNTLAAYVPPPKMIPSPEISLPFRVDTKITLELRDAELRDVLRGIMSYIGRNVIIDPTFPNDVLITMTLNDVRADEILNQFMRTYDLACYVSGANTLTFGTREGLYKLSGQLSVKQFKLHFAEPAQVSTMLKTLTALEDNAITADDRIKALYVRTNPAKMQEVEELIRVLDAPQKQVMIHASIFEFSDNNSAAVENALNIMYDDIRLSLGGTGGIAVNFRNDRSIRGTRDVWAERVVTNTFAALERNGKGKVLANPSVIAVDGKKAEINLTQDYPYVSGRNKDEGTVTWSTEEVGPKLTFTPRIGRDGYVTLTLDLSTGDVVGTQTSSTGEEMPITTTRSVKTDVRVRDGMPFVIGGLFREDNSKNVSKIPILGNIPLLGELFTYRYNSKQKSQVVMVITPYILDSN